MTRSGALIVIGGLAFIACAPADDPGGLTVEPGNEVEILSDDAENDWVGYRAGGNEPFWTLVLSDSTMDFDDLGTEVIASAPKPEPVATTEGWQFAAIANGQPFVMDVRPLGCNDSMSGRPFPHTVAVTVSGQTYHGCGGDTATLLTGAQWRVALIEGADTASVAPTMTFGEDGSLTGSGSCNNYRATYEITGEGLDIGPAVATKMACADEPLNQQESRFFSLLDRITRFDIVESRLQLYAQDTVVLVADR